jgi:hypothetical protein
VNLLCIDNLTLNGLHVKKSSLSPFFPIEIEPDILADEEDGEIVERTTKFEFNLGFAKVSRSIKKIKK